MAAGSGPHMARELCVCMFQIHNLIDFTSKAGERPLQESGIVQNGSVRVPELYSACLVTAQEAVASGTSDSAAHCMEFWKI